MRSESKDNKYLVSIRAFCEALYEKGEIEEHGYYTDFCYREQCGQAVDGKSGSRNP